MAKITYEDKVFINKNENVADKNKVNDTDLNEIKEVVNENDDKVGDLSNLNTNDKSSVVSAINEVCVAIGSNSNGTWRKYSNGDMECWFKQTVNTSVNNTWGSLYIAQISLHNFPQSFIETPYVLADLESSGGWQAFLGRSSNGGKATNSNPGDFMIFRATSAGNADYTINIYAKGKWK